MVIRTISNWPLTPGAGFETEATAEAARSAGTNPIVRFNVYHQHHSRSFAAESRTLRPACPRPCSGMVPRVLSPAYFRLLSWGEQLLHPDHPAILLRAGPRALVALVAFVVVRSAVSGARRPCLDTLPADRL